MVTTNPLLYHAGVYQIRNIITGERYIGSAWRLSTRFHRHRHMLATGTHTNHRLQEAWTQNGEGAFRFEPLAVLELDELKATEQRALDGVGDTPCYNALRRVLIQTFTPDARERIAATHRGTPKTAAHRAKIAAALRGRRCAEAHGKLTAERNRARVVSAETRAKMSRAHLGRFCSHMLGKRHTEEAKARMSEAQRAAWVRRKAEKR